MTGCESRGALHGGASFTAIGEDFQTLDRCHQVICADVLDAWFEPAPGVLAKVAEYLPFVLRTSPPVDAGGLVEAISRARGVPATCILTGGGSSDLIFALFPHLIQRGRTALILDPTYGEYAHVLGRLIGARVVRFELEKDDEFRVDPGQLLSSIEREGPDLVVLVNPNNPTGQCVDRRELLELIRSVPSSTLVVVDETYIDYMTEGASIEPDACALPNVLVIKSMSKAYALSGARAGYAVSNPEMIRRLAMWIPPWPVSLVAQVAAVEALANPDYYRGRYLETHKLRNEMAADLALIPGVTVYPGVANFVLVEVQGDARAIVERMRPEGVFIRDCDPMSERLRGRFVRIAVRTAEENARILRAFRKQIESD